MQNVAGFDEISSGQPRGRPTTLGQNADLLGAGKEVLVQQTIFGAALDTSSVQGKKGEERKRLLVDIAAENHFCLKSAIFVYSKFFW